MNYICFLCLLRYASACLYTTYRTVQQNKAVFNERKRGIIGPSSI
ncbi:unnamed protein product [Acanthoscelides obtectus]|uniref:Uncharacterized protein n=1 Tax=Acanthoscelides obtectus TaxID=200917 RepID=A0A9P0LEW3_ACAOB|nr:unnamed protein product [Acanthoscelides obtectus]CAK1620736.1 hypothetical protein AOBTE_LOCUS533 [Acanthoscelides obtectus]